MRVLLINTSFKQGTKHREPEYNLGLHKAANWLRAKGVDVTLISLHTYAVPSLFHHDFDEVWISAIFSWNVPTLLALARSVLQLGKPVQVGGPGCFGVRDVILQRTGLKAQATPDSRFERQPGSYEAVFWSRGCPAKNCALGFPKDGQSPICSVPTMEGWKFTLYRDATPAPVIMDNNLSALPREHQELIVDRSLAAGFKEVDANSGFEPRSFRPWTAELWKQLPLKAWRFAYDEAAEREPVLRMMEILDDAGVSRKARRIYCLAGNEPLADCETRVKEIQSWGSLPIVQRRRPLNYMRGPLPTLFDWDEQKLIDFQRWGNRLSGGMPFANYRRGMKDRALEPSFLDESN